VPNLTAEQVRKLDKPGRYGDGGGLYLNVAPGGSRSWIQRVRIDGRRLDKGLGGFPATTLTQARKLSDANRVAVADGRNPWADKEKAAVTVKPKGRGRARIPTFEEAARIAHVDQSKQFRNPKHAANWIQTLERHIFPVIGNIPVDEITRADVLAALKPIWWDIPDSARRIRLRVRTVLEWCVESDLVPANVERGITKISLPPQPKVVNHRKALPYPQVPSAIKTVRDSKAWDATRLCFELMVLTAARPGEARGMRWDEVDWDADLWNIPASRMKAGKEHRQPLSIQAMVLLRTARGKLDNGTGLVFPHPKNGKPLSEAALKQRADKCKLDCDAHGFRSSFRDWAAEQSGASYDAIEMSLAHAVGNQVERAYYRSDLLDQRRPLMQAWADYLDPLPF
jgi:integrase